MKQFKPEILIPKIDKEHNDSFFYEGEIAVITKPNGTRLSLIATGDIRITIKKGKEEYVYYNNDVDDATRRHKLTDRRLSQLENKGKLDWVNNNWFEVTWVKKGSDFADCDIGVVVWDYDDAIELLKSYYEDGTY